MVHEPKLNDTGCATRYGTGPFQRARPGGLAESLRHVLRDIEGHLVSGHADGGGAPDKQFTPRQIQLAAQGWAGAWRGA